MALPSLISIAQNVCVHNLLSECINESKETAKNRQYETEIVPQRSCFMYLTKMLETGCFTAISTDLLQRFVKYCPKHLSNRLLSALVPSHVRDLNITGCINVSLMGMMDIFERYSIAWVMVLKAP